MQLARREGLHSVDDVEPQLRETLLAHCRQRLDACKEHAAHQRQRSLEGDVQVSIRLDRGARGGKLEKLGLQWQHEALNTQHPQIALHVVDHVREQQPLQQQHRMLARRNGLREHNGRQRAQQQHPHLSRLCGRSGCLRGRQPASTAVGGARRLAGSRRCARRPATDTRAHRTDEVQRSDRALVAARAAARESLRGVESGHEVHRRDERAVLRYVAQRGETCSGGLRMACTQCQQGAHGLPARRRADVRRISSHQALDLDSDFAGQRPRDVRIELDDVLKAAQQLIRKVLLVRQQARTQVQQPEHRTLHEPRMPPRVNYDARNMLVHERPKQADAIAISQRDRQQQRQADLRDVLIGRRTTATLGAATAALARRLPAGPHEAAREV
mmetsp:Transcript_15024/g.62549  ORF Transcript_15024/g.62549 Transcript_15024/m.62549 type:complete len:386 (-) Transcript_15024:3029-4186(-)